MQRDLRWWRTQVEVHSITPVVAVLWAAGMPADDRITIDASSVPYHIRHLMIPGFICHAEVAALPDGGKVLRKWERQ